ncbi:hypothetical protein L208DRAFT_1396441 [Tricholoma matsutake]|nr:hypothetical protein L208DRAFT_1396441 [Tricholoma matsutake 945]
MLRSFCPNDPHYATATSPCSQEMTIGMGDDWRTTGREWDHQTMGTATRHDDTTITTTVNSTNSNALTLQWDHSSALNCSQARDDGGASKQQLR